MTGSVSQRETGAGRWPREPALAARALQSPVSQAGGGAKPGQSTLSRRGQHQEGRGAAAGQPVTAPEEGARPTPAQQGQVLGPHFWAPEEQDLPGST